MAKNLAKNEPSYGLPLFPVTRYRIITVIVIFDGLFWAGGERLDYIRLPLTDEETLVLILPLL
jgi:hypothetical protein